MADKKISELTDGGAAVSGDDYLVFVDSPAGTAVTKRSTVTDFLAASTFDTALTGRGVVLAGRTSASGLGWIDTDTTLAANSATKVPTQHAVKTYVDGLVTGATGDVHQADTSTSGWAWVDTDVTLAGDSASKVPTQHAVKSYVDSLPTLTTSDTAKVPISTFGGITVLDVTSLLSSAVANFSDSAFILQNASDATKQAQFSVSSVPTATTCTYNLPGYSVGGAQTIITDSGTQSLTNKTVVAPLLTTSLSTAGITIRHVSDVTSVNDGTRTNQVEQFGNLSIAPFYAFLHQSGGPTTFAQTAATSPIGRVSARGYTGTAYSSGEAARITFIADEAVTSSARGSSIVLATTPATTTTITGALKVSSESTPNVLTRGSIVTGTGSTLTTTTVTAGYGIECRSGAIGYSTGTGGTVTQTNSRTTAVTLNTQCGAITLVLATGGSGSVNTFTVNNSVVAATDIVVVSQKSGTDHYTISVSAVAAGSFAVTFTTPSNTNEQPVFNFAVVKAVTS